MSIQSAIPKIVSQDATQSGAAGDNHTRLSGRRLLLARLAWLIVVAFTVALFVFTIPLQFAEAQRICTSPAVNDCFNLGRLTPQLLQQLEQMGLSLSFYAVYNTVVQVGFPLLFLAVGALIFWRKSDDWMALLVSLMLVVFGLADTSNTPRLLPLVYPFLTFAILFLQFLGNVLLLFFIFLFPDGRLVPRWILWLIPFILLREGINVFLPNSDLANSAPWFVLQLVEVALALYAQIYRYRRVSGPVQRQQTKWVVYGLAMAFIGYFGFILLFGIGFTGWTTNVLAVLFLETLLPFFLSLIPLSILIAVLRYRLWDIDILINRTLVYVPLTAILAGIFAASITLSQKLFIAVTGEKSDTATVLTTLIVVAVFEPLKSGLQHLVDRRFKEGRDPSKELHAIRDRASALLQVIDVEPSTRHLLDAAVRAFDATGGALSLKQDGQTSVVYTSGEWTGEAALRVPLQADGVTLGELALGARRRGDDYSEQDRAALKEAIAPVVRALALTARLNGAQK